MQWRVERARSVPASAKAKRLRGSYVRMLHEAAIAGCQALTCPAFLVWYYIHYRVWVEGSPTVPLPNEVLADLGVTRDTKYRALRRLERAGLIHITRRGRRSPLVTLL